MKVGGRTYSYVVNRAEEGGYGAKCIELPQVRTEGKPAEVKKNMSEALFLTAEYLKKRAAA